MTFESTWEAFAERTAIMEYDGGLPRREAVFRAFELCFPGDYRECTRIAAGTPDGETALFNYLEGLLKPSNFDEESHRSDFLDKNKESYQEPPENPARARYEGFRALEFFTRRGIPIIGAYESGAMVAKQEPENFTTDVGEIADLMAGKGNRRGRAKGTPITRFYFIPADAELLCFDIDRKPGKVDGLEELYKLFGRDTLPSYLQDIELHNPCYVSTPSGGYHLYFKYHGEPVGKLDLAPGVEVKHGRPGLTVPGSRKANGEYILHGDINDAPDLDWIILDRIDEIQAQKHNPKQQEYKHTHQKHNPTTSRILPFYNPKQRITLDTLADEAVQKVSGHHDRQVSFAGRACRCKFPYMETLSYIKANSDIFGIGKNTENTVYSVYRDNQGII
jgi:hypothetical protein